MKTRKIWRLTTQVLVEEKDKQELQETIRLAVEKFNVKNLTVTSYQATTEFYGEIK